MLSYLGEVNWWAVLICAILSMVIGFIWYGPLFGKPWGRITGWTNEKVSTLPRNSMVRGYVLAFIAALIIASILSFTLLALGTDSIGNGIIAAVILWVGFTGATIGVNMTFERKPFSLFVIEAGYHLLTLIVYSIVLSIW